MMTSEQVPMRMTPRMHPEKEVFERSLCGLSKVSLFNDLKLASGPDYSADVSMTAV